MASLTRMEAAEYRKLAAVEDEMWYFRALHAHVERALVGALGSGGDASPSPHFPEIEGAAEAPRRHPRILDAGCGTGGLIRQLAPRHSAWRWTGVDIEPLACTLARERAGDQSTDIHEASVTALPFGEGTFDAVVSADVLYHVDDDAAALRQFFRVLRPGGTLVINVSAYRWLWSYHDEAVHARRRYGRGEVRAKLGAAGFAAPRATHWNALPFPLVVARRKFFPAPRDGSDVRLFPAPVESAFNAAMAVERGWLGAFGALPFGSSILAVARKP